MRAGPTTASSRSEYGLVLAKDIALQAGSPNRDSVPYGKCLGCEESDCVCWSCCLPPRLAWWLCIKSQLCLSFAAQLFSSKVHLSTPASALVLCLIALFEALSGYQTHSLLKTNCRWGPCNHPGAPPPKIGWSEISQGQSAKTLRPLCAASWPWQG